MAFAPELAEPASAAEADLTDRIREVYAANASALGEWVSIADIRRKLADVDPAALDAALRRLEQAADVNIVPDSNQKALSDADRQAAVTIGDQPKHFLAIGV